MQRPTSPLRRSHHASPLGRNGQSHDGGFEARTPSPAILKDKVPRGVKAAAEERVQAALSSRQHGYVGPPSVRQSVSPAYKRVPGTKRSHALVRTRTGDLMEHPSSRRFDRERSRTNSEMATRVSALAVPVPSLLQRSSSDSHLRPTNVTPQRGSRSKRSGSGRQPQSARTDGDTSDTGFEGGGLRRRDRDRTQPAAEAEPHSTAGDQEAEFFKPWETGTSKQDDLDFTRRADLEVYGECDADKEDDVDETGVTRLTGHRAAISKRYGATSAEQATRVLVTPSAKTLARRQQNLLLSERREQISPQHASEFSELISTLRTITEDAPLSARQGVQAGRTPQESPPSPGAAGLGGSVHGLSLSQLLASPRGGKGLRTDSKSTATRSVHSSTPSTPREGCDREQRDRHTAAATAGAAKHRDPLQDLTRQPSLQEEAESITCRAKARYLREKHAGLVDLLDKVAKQTTGPQLEVLEECESILRTVAAVLTQRNEGTQS